MYYIYHFTLNSSIIYLGYTKNINIRFNNHNSNLKIHKNRKYVMGFYQYLIDNNLTISDLKFEYIALDIQQKECVDLERRLINILQPICNKIKYDSTNQKIEKEKERTIKRRSYFRERNRINRFAKLLDSIFNMDFNCAAR